MKYLKVAIYSLYKKLARFISLFQLDRFKPVTAVHNFLVGILKPEAIEFAGHRIVLDRSDSLRLSMARGISLEMSTIRKVVKNGQVVLDIGAHIGSYSLTFAQLVGKAGKVFAFEPAPENFRLLLKNVKINGYDNIVCIPSAVGESTGIIKLYLSNLGQTDHRTYKTEERRRAIKVEMVRLSDYFRDYKEKINFVKIDTQGFEPRVLKGMKSLIERNRSIKILCEFWPEGLRLAGGNAREYLRLFEKLGFEILEINEREARLKKVSVDSLLRSYTIENKRDTNLLCLRN